MKLSTCPLCRHAEHDGYQCYNMASDNDCSCNLAPKTPLKKLPGTIEHFLEYAREAFGMELKSEDEGHPQYTGWPSVEEVITQYREAYGDV